MKQLQILLIIITAALFFTACEKKEDINYYDTISGILTPGENMSAEDLAGLEIYLGRFHDSVDFLNITFETTAIESVGATTLNADGSFSFDKLTPGNYGLVMGNGFIFSVDTALCIDLNGNNECFIKKGIDRLPEDNSAISFTATGIYISLKKGDLSSSYTLKKLHCYYGDSIFVGSYNVPEFNNNAIMDWKFTEFIVFATNDLTFKLEFWKDNDETKKITSVEIPLYDIRDTERGGSPNNGLWEGDLIDIRWVVEESPKFSLWFVKIGTEYTGYYTISDH